MPRKSSPATERANNPKSAGVRGGKLAPPLDGFRLGWTLGQRRRAQRIYHLVRDGATSAVCGFTARMLPGILVNDEPVQICGHCHRLASTPATPGDGNDAQ